MVSALTFFTARDIRLAARSITRQRGFAAVAIISLSLGIALNTTMYSVIDALVNPESGISHPEQVYTIRIWGDPKGAVKSAERAELLRGALGTTRELSYGAGASFRAAAVEFGRRYAQASAGVVMPNYFGVLGVRMLAGRTFADADLTSGDQPVIISEPLAATLFNDVARAVGVSIDIDGIKHPVIGVAARPFSRHDALWLLPPSGTTRDLVYNVVRLRDGASRADAERELSVVSARFATLANVSPKDTRFELRPYVEHQFAFWSFHYALIAAVAAVLLIACANLANLQLARGIGRTRELAVRAALGASRARLVGQLVLESFLLAAAGLVTGLLLTLWSADILRSRIPQEVSQYVVEPQVSWRVLAFAAAVCVFCVMLIGLLPAIRISRVDPNELLKAGAGTGATKRHRLQYGVMVIVELGMALALVSGAAIVVRSAMFFHELDVGFDYRPLSTAWMAYRSSRDTVIPEQSFESDVLARVQTLPGVAGASVNVPRTVRAHAVTAADADGSTRQLDAPIFVYGVVTASAVHTEGRRLVAGRDFSAGMASESQAIIDQRSARFLWPGGNPIGRLIKLGADTTHSPWVRVVGVMADRDRIDPLLSDQPSSWKESRLGDIMVLPGPSDSVRITGGRAFGFYLTVRAASDPKRMPVTLRRYFSRGLDANPLNSPGVSLLSAGMMEESLGIVRARQAHDFVAGLFLGFALLAIGLAALGIHGVISHSVAERRREIGVRIALGAASRDILHAVLREGNAIALAGIAVGLFCTKQTAMWLRAFSFEEDRYDAPLFAAVAAVLFVVAVASALAPALRATRIDPVEALRNE